jgi:predicted GIY-YIG superfamily endonuclease
MNMRLHVYLLTFAGEDDNLYYIGATMNPDKRRRQHEAAMIHHLHRNSRVQTAYDCCGLPTWSILATVNVANAQDAASVENVWIDRYRQQSPYSLCNAAPANADSFACHFPIPDADLVWKDI